MSIIDTKVMGILNVTPDSFYDGGSFFSLDNAIKHAQKMIAEGASIIDIGGESTRPGAASVSPEEEMRRVVPVVTALSSLHPEITISVDTSQPLVMQAAIEAGATMINDVRALQIPQALEIVAANNVSVCLMHMQNNPANMQELPYYGDVVEEVCAFLHERVAVAIKAGISRERLFIDPGFGFGKNLDHNLILFNALNEIKNEFKLPIIVGVSRKSMIGQLLDVGKEDRLTGSLALALLAVLKGANILRVHDVKPTMEVIKIMQGVFVRRRTNEKEVFWY